MLSKIVLSFKRSSGQVECNSHSPAIFLSCNFSTKNIFCSQKKSFFLQYYALDTFHISKPCREFFLLKSQQILPDLLFSLNEIFSSINPVGT